MDEICSLMNINDLLRYVNIACLYDTVYMIEIHVSFLRNIRISHMYPSYGTTCKYVLEERREVQE